MALSTITLLGQKEASGDAYALFLSKFGGEVYTTYKQKNTTEGLFLEATLSEAKETKERWTGDQIASDFTAGTDIMSDSNALYVAKFTEYLVRIDDTPMYVANAVNDFNQLMSPSGEQDRMRMAQKQGEALAYKMDLKRISTLIQTASMPGANVQPGTNPYETKITAGSAAGLSSNILAGLHVVDLKTTPSGAAIEDALFKFQDYFDYLNMPSGEGDRFCLILPQLARAVVKDSGIGTPYGFTTAASTERKVSKSLHEDLGDTVGSYSRGTVGRIAGFDIIPSPHLNAFGTKVDAAFSPSATLGSKYAPGTAFATTTIYGIQGISGFPANSGVFDQGAGAGNCTQWKTSGVKVMDLFNNVQFIVGIRRRSCKTNIVQGIMPEVSYQHRAFAWLISNRLLSGCGPIDPMSVAYCASAVAS